MSDDSGFQPRALERYALAEAVDIYDGGRDVYLGRLVNIHSQGLMLIGDQPLEENKIYQLDLHLPRSVNGRNTVHLGVDCLWTRNAIDNSKHWSGGKHWAGFAIIDISPEAAEDIHALISVLGGQAYS